MEGGNMTDTDKVILSDEAAVASRNSLAALSALLIRPDDAPSNTLEGLVRDMLRPMLREWLDANLPELVEKMVAKEIARLTEGRL
jgi:cell pole-organizing protein PopZ